jgi:hypothetical protein
MHLPTLILHFLFLALTILASPIASPDGSPITNTSVSAGTVTTNKAVTYTMTHLNEIKAFDDKVDNGNYPYPVSYSIASGYTCIFYLYIAPLLAYPVEPSVDDALSPRANITPAKQPAAWAPSTANSPAPRQEPSLSG